MARRTRSSTKKRRRDLLPGGLYERKPPRSVDLLQLQMGIRVELGEHTHDPRIAREIALDHLSEDPRYYTKLARMEAGACGDRGRRSSADVRHEPWVIEIYDRGRWLLGRTDDRVARYPDKATAEAEARFSLDEGVRWRASYRGAASRLQQRKIRAVMREYKHGQLRSGSERGPRVRTRSQAVAIAISEARRAAKRRRRARQA